MNNWTIFCSKYDHVQEVLFYVHSRTDITTARCTIVQSAVLGLHVVLPSVCPSVCNVGGSGQHRLEILETNCTDNKGHPPILGEHGEFLGRLEVGWEKVACWNTKAAIYLKRVKDIGTVTMEGP